MLVCIPDEVDMYSALSCLPRHIKSPTFPLHYGDNAKVKTQNICPAIHRPAQGLGAAVTGQQLQMTALPVFPSW